MLLPPELSRFLACLAHHDGLLTFKPRVEKNPSFLHCFKEYLVTAMGKVVHTLVLCINTMEMMHPRRSAGTFFSESRNQMEEWTYVCVYKCATHKGSHVAVRGQLVELCGNWFSPSTMQVLGMERSGLRQVPLFTEPSHPKSRLIKDSHALLK